MRYNKVLLKVWDEYTTEVDRGDGLVIPVCGLCGNSGVVDTRPTAELNGSRCGVRLPCICPNGRHLKKSQKFE